MHPYRGFTLVEILIVVLILGILAAIALPQFSNATTMARTSMLRDDLRVFRAQLEVFKAQHDGVPPGYPGCDATQQPTEAALIAQMTQASTSAGQTAAPGTAGFKYGPYMSQIPVNPVNNKTTVRVLADGADFPAAADDAEGWLYQPSTMMLRANSTGVDSDGAAFISY